MYYTAGAFFTDVKGAIVWPIFVVVLLFFSH